MHKICKVISLSDFKTKILYAFRLVYYVPQLSHVSWFDTIYRSLCSPEQFIFLHFQALIFFQTESAWNPVF
jgi:hypothetical protein